VTVGYGEDEAMFDSWGDDVEWWDIVPPREECTRFRIFYPDEYEIVPRVIVDVMAALGACARGLGTPRRVAPTTIASAVKSTISGQKAIRSRNSFKIGSRVLPLPSRRTVDELATFAIGWSSRSTRTSVRTSNREPDAPSTKQWQSRCSKKGRRYEVQSASGSWYEVDVISVSCTCPTGSNERPRAAAANTSAGWTTKSSRDGFPARTVDSRPGQTRDD